MVFIFIKERQYIIGLFKNKFNFVMTENEKKALQKEFGIKKDDFVIIYAAELSKRKNQGMLMKAVKELNENGIKNIKVLLPGLDSMNGYYQKLSKELEIEDNIKFLGYREDIPKLMKISDVAVSTSKQEGLPVNIMEAMFSNLPVIATNCRGNRDIIKDNQNGYLVEIGDISKLKESIHALLKNKENTEKNTDYIKKYELNNIIKEMENIYNSEI